ALLDDEETRRVVARRGDVDRRAETGRHQHGRDRGAGRGRNARTDLQPARRRASVAVDSVAVVAVLAGVDDAVPARHVLAEAVRRAAVAVGGVAVVALLGVVDDAVAAARGVPGGGARRRRGRIPG